MPCHALPFAPALPPPFSSLPTTVSKAIALTPPWPPPSPHPQGISTSPPTLAKPGSTSTGSTSASRFSRPLTAFLCPFTLPFSALLHCLSLSFYTAFLCPFCLLRFSVFCTVFHCPSTLPFSLSFTLPFLGSTMPCPVAALSRCRSLSSTLLSLTCHRRPPTFQCLPPTLPLPSNTRPCAQVAHTIHHLSFGQPAGEAVTKEPSTPSPTVLPWLFPLRSPRRKCGVSSPQMQSVLTSNMECPHFKCGVSSLQMWSVLTSNEPTHLGNAALSGGLVGGVGRRARGAERQDVRHGGGRDYPVLHEGVVTAVPCAHGRVLVTAAPSSSSVQRSGDVSGLAMWGGSGAGRGGAARRGGCKQTDRRIYTAVCTGRPDDADLAGWPEDLLPPVYGPPAMPPPARPCCFLNANPPRPELTLERPRDLPSVALQESTL